MHPFDLIFIGLACDVVGAVVLAKSFMLKDPQDAYYEGLPVFGGNKSLLKSALLQRSEARVGGAFLVAGFVLQMWGNLHGGIAATQPGWINSTWRMVLVTVMSACVALVALWIARRQSSAAFHQILFRDYSGQTKLHPTEGDATWFDRTGRLYDTKRRAGESDQAFLARLEQRRIALGKRYGGRAKDFIADA
jgi:hypothetical protein